MADDSNTIEPLPDFDRMILKPGDVLVLRPKTAITASRVRDFAQVIQNWKDRHSLALPVMIVPNDFELFAIRREDVPCIPSLQGGQTIEEAEPDFTSRNTNRPHPAYDVL